jgi:ParB family transcriptional regulator, chromosome partitioning protein
VPIEQLVPGPYQPRRRFDDESLGQLAESIARHGVLQPILVRRDPRAADRFQIVAGERRWRAAQRARLHEVPVVVREMDDRDTLEVALIENIQRQDLSPLEEAEGYRRLIEEFQHTQEALAKAVGRSRSHVANMMRLLTLPEPVKRMVDDGRLSAGHARALLSVEDPVRTAEEIVTRGLTVRDIERRTGAPRKPPAPTVVDPNTAQLERELSDKIGLAVEIQAGAKPSHGKLVIRYASLDQLDDVVARLTRRR